ncbi:hypothetical protein PG984_015153 [Apiospora sp. TS-2023a]
MATTRGVRGRGDAHTAPVGLGSRVVPEMNASAGLGCAFFEIGGRYRGLYRAPARCVRHPSPNQAGWYAPPHHRPSRRSTWAASKLTSYPVPYPVTAPHILPKSYTCYPEKSTPLKGGSSPGDFARFFPAYPVPAGGPPSQAYAGVAAAPWGGRLAADAPVAPPRAANPTPIHTLRPGLGPKPGSRGFCVTNVISEKDFVWEK